MTERLPHKIGVRPQGNYALRERAAYFDEWKEENSGSVAPGDPEYKAPTGAWNAEKVEAFRAAFYEFLGYLRINSKEKGGDYRIADGLYEAQYRFLDTIFDGLAEDIHDFKCLKSRQLGMSTISRALVIFWLGMHRGMQGAMIFDTESHKEEAREEIEQMIQSLEPDLGFPRILKLNRYNLSLSNNSRLRFMAAGTRTTKSSGVLGRSSGINLVHACMAPGTPVLVADGRVVPIEQVGIGEKVVTHAGAAAKVIANVGRANDRGPMIHITPWLGSGVLMTGDHKIPTQRGLLPAREVKKTDLLIMPVRQITCDRTLGFLPATPSRPQHGGSVAAAAGAEIVFDEEFGFAIGYYLAEGSITYQRRDEQYYNFPSGIVFSRHRNEVAYADRAIAAILPYTTGHRSTKNRPHNLTTVENVYGSALARWIDDNFGGQDRKHIPDEVFTWGREFCCGLLAGLLSGDGSKKLCRLTGGYTINRVNLVSTRASIAMQARDLAAALGYGWASVRSRPAGRYYGRNCKEIWSVDWCGQAGADLRQLIGLPIFPVRRWIEKYKIEHDRVLIKIRSIESGIDVPTMWDLSVDHPDHTFRTPWMAVSNSEMCSWENEEGVVALTNALSRTYPDRLYIWESTARGFNAWHDMWETAKKDDLNQRTLFTTWYHKDDQRIPRGTAKFERYGTDPPSEREVERIELVREMYDYEIDPEQLAWYRELTDPSREADGDEPEDSYQLQDQPWVEEDAFQQTGATFFEGSKLRERMVAATQKKFSSYKFVPGTDFVTTEIYPAKLWRDVDIKVWEEPVHDAVYVVSADPAFGHNPKSNYSAVEVGRCYADQIEQVAEFTSTNTLTHQLAYLLWALVGWYGSPPGSQVLTIIEINGPGESVWREYNMTRQVVQNGYLRVPAREKGLTDVFQNARNYVYQRSDSLSPGHNFHWKTTQQLKVAIMERLRDFVHIGGIVLNSADALEEMKAITRDGDEIGGEGSARDDRTISLAMMVRAWEEKLRRGLIAQNRTKESDIARRRLNIVDQMQLHNRYRITEFFARKSEVRRQELYAAQRRSLHLRARIPGLVRR